MTQTTRKRVGIVIFPDVEVLDFCGPFEVFAVTRLNEAAQRQSRRPSTWSSSPKPRPRSPPAEGCESSRTTASTTPRRSMSWSFNRRRV